MTRRLVIFLAVNAASIGLDQWTKVLATEQLKGRPPISYLGGTFVLQYATNDGAFLSLGSSLPPWARFWLLTVGVGILLLALAVYAVRSRALDDFQVVSYALIVSGGLSNWVDRARFGGKVVDFMNLGFGSLPSPRTGVFNVADLAILVGIGLLFLQDWRLRRQQRRTAPPPAAPAPSTSGPPSRGE